MNKNNNYEKRKLIERYYAKNWTARQIVKRLGLFPIICSVLFVSC